MHPGRTARNHLLATAALSAIPVRRVDEVLAEVGLENAADQRAGSFSLGMRQRLALAGALLGEPEVLLLDEPSNGLDPDGIRWLRNTLTAFARVGGTVFVSSHLIGELEMFADDLVVVGGGRLLAAEPVASTLARGHSTVVVRTPQAAELAELLDRRDLEIDAIEHRLSIRGTTTATEVQHGTMATAVTAQPARWVTVAAKTAIAACFGLAMGASGMIGGLSGTLLGGLQSGDTSAMPAKAIWGLLVATLAPLLGLGIGMILRHSAAAVSVLLVWVFVLENLIRTLIPANVQRFLPFSAANGLLGTATGTDTPEMIAAELSRVQDAFLFGGYAAAALAVGTVLLYRRDMT